MPYLVHFHCFVIFCWGTKYERTWNLEIPALPFKLLGVLCVSNELFLGGETKQTVVAIGLVGLISKTYDGKGAWKSRTGGRSTTGAKRVDRLDYKQPIYKSERIKTTANEKRKKAKRERENSFSLYEGQVLSLSNCYF